MIVIEERAKCNEFLVNYPDGSAFLQVLLPLIPKVQILEILKFDLEKRKDGKTRDLQHCRDG